MTKICLKQEILNIMEAKVDLMFNCIIIKLNIIDVLISFFVLEFPWISLS